MPVICDPSAPPATLALSYDSIRPGTRKRRFAENMCDYSVRINACVFRFPADWPGSPLSEQTVYGSTQIDMLCRMFCGGTHKYTICSVIGGNTAAPRLQGDHASHCAARSPAQKCACVVRFTRNARNSLVRFKAASRPDWLAVAALLFATQLFPSAALVEQRNRQRRRQQRVVTL